MENNIKPRDTGQRIVIDNSRNGTMPATREQILKTLHTAATEIQACESVEAACEQTVGAAEEILEYDICSITLERDGWLQPAAVSSGSPEDGIRPVRNDQGLAGKTYQTGESYVVDQVEPDDDTDPAKDTFQSGISVPIGDVGVFQAVSYEPAGFDNADVELAELLVAHTARTIDRLQYEQELQSSREALQRQNERLERFTSVVSHDLRNPLGIATGRLEIARTESDQPNLDEVADALGRMETLIEELLTLAQTGKAIDEMESVNIGELAGVCWQTVGTTESEIIIDTNLSIRADRSRLRQLFENLFTNAIQHNKTPVSIRISHLDDDTGFYIADTGTGIPTDQQESVFEWGYSSRESGTGFGLAIVQDIVDAHDWSISVTTSDTGGTKFEVRGVETI